MLVSTTGAWRSCSKADTLPATSRPPDARRSTAHPVVLGLAWGGVVVAYDGAVAVDAPLDVLVARNLGALHQTELAFGVIALQEK